MKHKSRRILPILTFLTFGMVTGSIVATDYSKDFSPVTKVNAYAGDTEKLYLAGTFNSWDTDNTDYPMPYETWDSGEGRLQYKATYNFTSKTEFRVIYPYDGGCVWFEPGLSDNTDGGITDGGSSNFKVSRDISVTLTYKMWTNGGYQTLICDEHFFSISASSESDSKGSVSVSSGSVSYNGSTTLNATPESGYTFRGWTKDGGSSFVSTSNPYVLEDISADASYTAYFSSDTGTDLYVDCGTWDLNSGEKPYIHYWDSHTTYSDETNPTNITAVYDLAETYTNNKYWKFTVYPVDTSNFSYVIYYGSSITSYTYKTENQSYTGTNNGNYINTPSNNVSTVWRFNSNGNIYKEILKQKLDDGTPTDLSSFYILNGINKTFPTAATLTGYDFRKWSTAETGDSGTEYTGGTGYSFSANQTIYARYTTKTYSVVYDDNMSGPTHTETKSHWTDHIVLTYTEAGFTRPSFRKFDRWCTNYTGEGGTSYTPGQHYTNNEGTTLYAIWSYFTVQYRTRTNSSASWGSWTTMIDHDRGGNLHYYDTSSDIVQTKGMQVQFQYLNETNTPVTIAYGQADNYYGALVGDCGNNFEYDDNHILTCKYNGVTGKFGLRLNEETSKFVFYPVALGMDDKTGESKHYDLVINDTFVKTAIETTNYQWKKENITLNPGDVIKFSSTTANAVFRPNYFNTSSPYIHDHFDFTYTDDAITSDTLVCKVGGVYDIYIQGSHTGEGNTFYVGDRETWTMAYNLNGHDHTSVSSEYVSRGNAATEPDDPDDDVIYRFDGWYTEATCETEWDFETALTGDVTLYAKWNLDLITELSADGSGVTVTYFIPKSDFGNSAIFDKVVFERPNPNAMSGVPIVNVIPLEDLDGYDTENKAGYYEFGANINFAELEDDITVSFFKGELEKFTWTCTAGELIEAEKNPSEAVIDIYKIILNAGARAQLASNYHIDNLASQRLTWTEINTIQTMMNSVSIEDITGCGYGVIGGGALPSSITNLSSTIGMDGKIAARISFDYTGSEDVTAALNGSSGFSISSVKKVGNHYTVDVTTTADKFNTKFRVDFTFGETRTFGVVYAYNKYYRNVLMDSNASNEQKNLAKALYLYYDITKA